MSARFWTGLKRFVLWDYPRACWQYDVMVALILAFIFLTPRGWFRDQPRIFNASSITMLPAAHGANVFWVDMDLLNPVPETERAAGVQEMLEMRTKAADPDSSGAGPGQRAGIERLHGFHAVTVNSVPMARVRRSSL